MEIAMNIEEIEEHWNQDSQIDETDLAKSARNIPILHAKYYPIYMKQKMLLIKMRTEYKSLKLAKYEFYINPDEEGLEKGWEIPPQGRLIKSEVNTYLEGDKDLIKAELKIGIQEEKVNFLKSIIDTLNGRNFVIKNMIDDRRFMSGG